MCLSDVGGQSQPYFLGGGGEYERSKITTSIFYQYISSHHAHFCTYVVPYMCCTVRIKMG